MPAIFNAVDGMCKDKVQRTTRSEQGRNPGKQTKGGSSPPRFTHSGNYGWEQAR